MTRQYRKGRVEHQGRSNRKEIIEEKDALKRQCLVNKLWRKSFLRESVATINL